MANSKEINYDETKEIFYEGDKEFWDNIQIKHF